MAVLGLPGVKRDGIRVGRGLRDTRSPPGSLEQRSEAWDGVRGGGDGAELAVRVRWRPSGSLGSSIRCVVGLSRRTEGQGRA